MAFEARSGIDEGVTASRSSVNGGWGRYEMSCDHFELGAIIGKCEEPLTATEDRKAEAGTRLL